MKCDLIEKGLRYDDSLLGVEDYDLYMKADDYTMMTNIMDSELFIYRRTTDNASYIYKDRDDDINNSLLKNFYVKKLGLELSDLDAERLECATFLRNFKHLSENDVANEVTELDAALHRVEAAFESSHQYEKKYYYQSIKHRWVRAQYTINGLYKGNIPSIVNTAIINSDYYKAWC